MRLQSYVCVGGVAMLEVGCKVVESAVAVEFWSAVIISRAEMCSLCQSNECDALE